MSHSPNGINLESKYFPENHGNEKKYFPELNTCTLIRMKRFYTCSERFFCKTNAGWRHYNCRESSSRDFASGSMGDYHLFATSAKPMKDIDYSGTT